VHCLEHIIRDCTSEYIYIRLSDSNFRFRIDREQLLKFCDCTPYLLPLMAKEGSRQDREGPLALSDASSDTVSVTLSEASIDTPSLSGERTLVADEESEPLLSEERPPHYEDIVRPVSEQSSQKAPVKDGGEDHLRGNDIQRDLPISNGRGRRRCWRRGSTRARRALIFLKIAVLLGVLSYFVGTLCLRFMVGSSKRQRETPWNLGC
jgi:hypothetical protein